MNIEALLTARIGDAGKRLHTARSRNDQVALDFRMYVKQQLFELRSLTLSLLGVIADIAAEHTGSIMPAYTHLQRAQPTTFAHHMLAYAQMLKRDITRFEDAAARLDELPLGSGACTGTTYPINRRAVADALGFARVTENSLDGVSDRDFALETLSCISILMMHLSRLSEELILWSSWEFRFVELDDAYTTGSSIMPQKKNPDLAELCRGKTGRVYGDMVTLFTVMKSLPLAYNKDMQEDKEPVFDAVDTACACLRVFAPMLKTMKVHTENLRRAAAEGFINATDCADYLVKKGMPFRSAYTVVGHLVQRCTALGKTLETLSIDEYKSLSESFENDVYEAISLEHCISLRRVIGSVAKEETLRQLETVRSFINERA